MPLEIYNYDITTHERFARDQQAAEAFQKQYHIPPSGAGTVAIQTRVLDLVPKHSAVVLLMQTFQRKLWAKFGIPKNFYLQRFASSYVAPSLGSTEKQEADILRLEAFLNKKTGGRFARRKKREEGEGQGREQGKKNNEEEMMEEGDAIIEFLDKGVKETNEMVDYVISRMHQFVQA